MNRIEAQGLAAECMRGRRVMLIVGLWTDATALLERVIAAFPDESAIKSVRRSAGRQAIETVNGGRLIIMSSRSTVRGHTADTVFIDEGAGRHVDMTDLNACVAASRGDVIRA